MADLPGQRTDLHEGRFTPYVAMVTLVAVSRLLLQFMLCLESD